MANGGIGRQDFASSNSLNTTPTPVGGNGVAEERLVNYNTPARNLLTRVHHRDPPFGAAGIMANANGQMYQNAHAAREFSGSPAFRGGRRSTYSAGGEVNSTLYGAQPTAYVQGQDSGDTNYLGMRYFRQQ